MSTKPDQGRIERLWAKLMIGEPEPEQEITSSDINQQTMDRMQENYS